MQQVSSSVPGSSSLKDKVMGKIFLLLLPRDLLPVRPNHFKLNEIERVGIRYWLVFPGAQAPFVLGTLGCRMKKTTMSVF